LPDVFSPDAAKPDVFSPDAAKPDSHPPGRSGWLPPGWPPPSAPPAVQGRAIGRYAAPRRPSPWIILAVAVAVVAFAAIAISALVPSGGPTPGPAPSSTPSATRSGGAVVDTGSVKGYWSIVSQRWEARSVTVSIEITVDKGLLYYSLYAFGNEDAETLQPIVRDDLSLTAGYVNTGQTLTGTVTFATHRQGLTLVMFDGVATQLSALQISA
jgi:hypothetical protein